MILITFPQALEKWQIKLNLKVESFLSTLMFINEKKDLLEKRIRFFDLFTDAFCLEEWEDRKNDKKIQDILQLLHEIKKFEVSMNEFIDTLFLKKVPCYLSESHEEYRYKPFPYTIFYQYKSHILQRGGYITISNKVYLVCFNEKIFNDFLEEVARSYKIIYSDTLDRGSHTPEGRALKKALIELNDIFIRELHAVVDDNNNKKSDLASKLQQWEPDLNDKWAINLSILLSKFIKEK